MSDQDSDGHDGDAAERVNIDYIKGTLFRTISPTGLIGSITPQGKVQIGLYSERQAIPQRVTYQLDETGALGRELETIGRDAVVRELEAVVTLDRGTAKLLAAFLSSCLQGSDGDDQESPEGKE